MCQDSKNVSIAINVLDLPDSVSQSSLIVNDSILLLALVVTRRFLEFQYMICTRSTAQDWGEDVTGTLVLVEVGQWRRVDRLG